MRPLLRLPGFTRLVTAYTINHLAWAVGTLALAVLVYRRTGSALGSAAFFLCSQALPAIVSPPIVARLDRLSPRVILPVLYWLEAVLFGVLAWLTHRFSLAPVLALSVLDGAVATTARSLASAARTEILKPAGLLREGNALTNGTFTVAFMAGPLIGGGIVALGGTVAALLVNCGLFAVMGLTLVSRSIPSTTVDEGPSQGRLRAALAHLRRDRPVATLLVLEGIVYVFFTISIPVEVVYAQHTLHAGPGGYGGLMSAWGGGAVVGSIAFARFRYQSVRVMITAATAIMGIGFAIMTVAPTLVVALVGAVVAGIANGICDTAFVTEIQDRSPQSWMALIMSVNQSVGDLAPGLGILLGGLIASLATARIALGVAGTGCLVLAVVIGVALAPSRMAARAGDGPRGPDGGEDEEDARPRAGPAERTVA